MVTSSAVVGSSANRIFGLPASAIAITARCRIPPEKWYGYSRIRSAGRLMPVSVISSRTRACVCAPVSFGWCLRTASAICAPTVIVGSSAVIGS